jgi:hypothetical protein
MLYVIVLLIHSWLRWGVLLAALALLGRSVAASAKKLPWEPIDRRLGAAFLSALDTQVALGLLLYFVLSPLTPKSLADYRTYMPIAALRFFAVEHIFGMLLALAAAHIGWARAKKSADDAQRRRRVAIGVALALVAIAVTIPWPPLPYGRPLFRGP